MASIIKLIMKFIAPASAAAVVSDARAFVVQMCTVLIDNLRGPFSKTGTIPMSYPVIKADSNQIIIARYIIT